MIPSLIGPLFGSQPIRLLLGVQFGSGCATEARLAGHKGCSVGFLPRCATLSAGSRTARRKQPSAAIQARRAA